MRMGACLLPFGDAAADEFDIILRRRIDQPPCVLLARVLVDILRRPEFNNPAVVHHGHHVGHEFHHAQVVADKDIRQPALVLQLLQ